MGKAIGIDDGADDETPDGSTGSCVNPGDEQAVKRWVYCTVQMPRNALELWEAKLLNLGLRGWEAVCTLESDSSQYLLMKREVYGA